MIFLLIIGLAQAEWVRGCEFNLPIAGSAGFANGQAARQTNNNTYSAAAFYERQVVDQRQAMIAAVEANITWNAATIPTLCDDFNGFNSVYSKNDNKLPVYGEPLDLYAANAAVGVGSRYIGGFYSASVTQSILGYRYAALPELLMQAYPLAFAPLIGVWQRGDGVASYSLDWIGGGYVESPWGGVRVGYTGTRGVYTSVDERIVGLFGSVSLPAIKEEITENPWSFLKFGLQEFTLAQFGLDDIHNKVGTTTAFFRDLPFGEIAGAGSEANSNILTPVAQNSGSSDAQSDGTRLKTLHFRQHSMMKIIDIDATYALKPQAQLFEGMIGVHTPNYYPMHLVLRDKDQSPEQGFLVKLGMTQLPPRYALGVEGGRFFSAKAEYRSGPVFVMLLFNDAEQLAIYPFATNALSFRIGVSAQIEDL